MLCQELLVNALDLGGQGLSHNRHCVFATAVAICHHVQVIDVAVFRLGLAQRVIGRALTMMSCGSSSCVATVDASSEP